MIKKILGIIIALSVVAFWIGQMGYKQLYPPQNALIFINSSNTTYTSFPCLVEKENLRLVFLSENGPESPQELDSKISQKQIIEYRDNGTSFVLQIGSDAKEIHSPSSYTALKNLNNADMKINPDPECRNKGGFIQDSRSLSGQFLEKIGLLSPIKSRWNSDGSWNW